MVLWLSLLLTGCFSDRTFVEPCHETETVGSEGTCVAWVPGIPDPGFEESCLDCARRECGAERNLCLDPATDCYERLQCFSRCDDPNCRTACASEFFVRQRECEEACREDPYCLADCAEGLERFSELSGCLLNNRCRNDCNVGRNWSCVGEYDWEEGKAGDEIVVELEILDAIQLVGIPGVRVSPCPFVSCADPPIGTTDRRGRIEVPIELQEVGLFNSGFFNGSFQLVSEQPPFEVRSTWILGRPVARPLRLRKRVPNAFRYVPPEALERDLAEAAVIGEVVDCMAQPASGVSISMDLETETTTQYVEGDSGFSAEREWTDRSGLFRVFPLPEIGVAEPVIGSIQSGDGGSREVGRIAIRTQPATTTIIRIWPTTTEEQR